MKVNVAPFGTAGTIVVAGWPSRQVFSMRAFCVALPRSCRRPSWPRPACRQAAWREDRRSERTGFMSRFLMA
jgi:hypothetical protein